MDGVFAKTNVSRTQGTLMYVSMFLGSILKGTVQDSGLKYGSVAVRFSEQNPPTVGAKWKLRRCLWPVGGKTLYFAFFLTMTNFSLHLVRDSNRNVNVA